MNEFEIYFIRNTELINMNFYQLYEYTISSRIQK